MPEISHPLPAWRNGRWSKPKKHKGVCCEVSPWICPHTSPGWSRCVAWSSGQPRGSSSQPGLHLPLSISVRKRSLRPGTKSRTQRTHPGSHDRRQSIRFLRWSCRERQCDKVTHSHGVWQTQSLLYKPQKSLNHKPLHGAFYIVCRMLFLMCLMLFCVSVLSRFDCLFCLWFLLVVLIACLYCVFLFICFWCFLGLIPLMIVLD